jgi:Mn-dependent DtxR family transcriptional regulator
MSPKEQFQHEPVSHSVAHYLVAISDLRDQFGYARVSDVARTIGITRGSASISLKSLKQKGLVTEDENRFLGLSDAGQKIADSIRAKKEVMRDLFVRVLGVEAEQADQDTCKVEHLISGSTAERAQRLIRFLDDGGTAADSFRKEFAAFNRKLDSSGNGGRKRAKRSRKQR